jgi:hypothetical protein
MQDNVLTVSSEWKKFTADAGQRVDSIFGMEEIKISGSSRSQQILRFLAYRYEIKR